MMNKLVWFLLLIISPHLAYSDNVRFIAPDIDFPYYRLVFEHKVVGETINIKELQINGKNWPYYFIFKSRKTREKNKPLESGNYEIQVDYAWKNSRKYEIRVVFSPENNREEFTRLWEGKAPRKNGIPDGEEGFYRIFRLEETADLKRKQELVTAVFTVPKIETEKEDFILLQEKSEVNYQILDTKENNPVADVVNDHPVTLTYKVVFPVDINSRSKKIYLLVKGKKGAAYVPGFTIRELNDGIGKTIKGKQFGLEFHPQNGQIKSIEYYRKNVRLFNDSGVVHGNPSCHVPGVAWDHSYNWINTPNLEEKAGQYLYINSRRGPLQKLRDVELEVRYSMEVNSSFFVSETKMKVNRDLSVVSLNNDKMILHRDLFDTLIYKNKKNKVVKKTLNEIPIDFDGLIEQTAADCDWVGLLNSKEKYGFFSLRIAYVNSNLSSLGGWMSNTGTNFHSQAGRDLVYWVRPLINNWSDPVTRNLLTFVPAGSWFYEKNAYVILELNKGYAKRLDEILRKLQNPIRIY